MNRPALKTAVLAAAVLASGALAETKTASTRVSMAVLPDCSLSATDLDLGVYNARTGASGTATVRAKCNVAAEVTFVPNNTPSALNNRVLSDGKGNTIPYYLEELLPPGTNNVGFLNPFAEIGFNNTATSGYWSVKSTAEGSSFVVRGTVAPGLWKPAGQYSETITFSMTYTP